MPLIDQNTGEVLDRDLVGGLDLSEQDPEGKLIVVDLKTSAKTRGAGRGREDGDGNHVEYLVWPARFLVS